MNPPANISSHNNKLKSQNYLINGIGAAQNAQKNARDNVTYNVFGDSNPPREVVIAPPTITPATGPVILITPNAVNAYVSSASRADSM